MRKKINDLKFKKLLGAIGHNVERLRGSMSQAELAKKTGVSRSTIQAIESGRSIQLSNLFKIATVFKISLGQLCGEEISGDISHEKLRKIVMKILRNIFARRV